jgi:hypothetical protein
MPRAQPPADNLSGFKVKYDRQVVLFAHESQMGKVLHPSAGMHHFRIALSCLWTLFVTEHREVFEGIWCGSYLCWWLAAVSFLFAEANNGDASERSDAPGFLLAPAKMQRQPTDTVERVLNVGLAQLADCLFVPSTKRVMRLIVAAAGNPEFGYKMLVPPWVDFLQDG